VDLTAPTKFSGEKVLDPPSTMIWPARAVETTVTSRVAAHWSGVQAPLATVFQSL
jgi:hypothetical protein